jgi:hypothetical protein
MGPQGATGPAGPTPSTAAVAFKLRIENIAPWTMLASGAGPTAVGATSVGPIGPSGAYEIEITAGTKQAFSFVSMFGESNDWFFGPGPEGIALYDDMGKPTSGDVTSQISLWNAGTEVDQEPAVGPDVGPNQASPTQGDADPDATVRVVPDMVPLTAGGTFARPAIKDMIRVTVTPKSDRRFVVRIENLSTDSTLVTSKGNKPIHLSPPAWALHNAPGPFFTTGQPDRGRGLEYVAESGRYLTLQGTNAELTGAATAISPGVWVTHASGEPIFSEGLMDRGQGLERIAESGNVKPLSDLFTATLPTGASATGVFNTPVGAMAPGPAAPGSAYELTVSAKPGEKLSFATMFGWSNDWFFATPAGGLALFSSDGKPISGDITGSVLLLDAGTEVNQLPAIGADTGPQQSMPDQGAADPIALVREVTEYARPVHSHLRVTITPM